MQSKTPPGYEQKFESFIKMCEVASQKGAGVLVAMPCVLGDTYDEIIESLSRLADAKLTLHIARR